MHFCIMWVQNNRCRSDVLELSSYYSCHDRIFGHSDITSRKRKKPKNHVILEKSQRKRGIILLAQAPKMYLLMLHGQSVFL